MLSITDLKTGTKLSLNDEPYTVLSYYHSKMGRGGAVVKTKLKNLKTGATIDKTFQGADRIEEAQIIKKSATYLYSDDEKAYFMDAETFDQFEIPQDIVGNDKKYLVENSNVDILYFNNEPMNVELPIKMAFRVTSAPPGVKGNSSGGVTKKVTIETGAQIDAPLFIKENDKIIIDTRSGTYIERA